MQISPVTRAAQTPPDAPRTARDARTTVAAAASPPAASSLVSATEVSAAIVQRATGDGDGRTGTAALNDGDAAARVAAASRSVDVRA